MANAAARSRPRSLRWKLGAAGVVLVGVFGLLSVRTTTKQGVNYRVTTKSIPVYAKVIGFLDRHEQYRVLAREIAAGLTTDEAKARAVFEWTHEHIRKTPEGWPVVDDHILHIIIRGYGAGDQATDVFTTLSTYAGVPAFWVPVRINKQAGRWAFAFARIGGRWRMFDVEHYLIFTDGRGGLADVEELLASSELIRLTANNLAPGGIPYQQYMDRLQPFRVPTVLRAEKQMPLPRVAFEIRRACRLVLTTDRGRPDAASDGS